VLFAKRKEGKRVYLNHCVGRKIDVTLQLLRKGKGEFAGGKKAEES